MSEDLRSRVKELETTVDALTDEIVDLQDRLDEMESEEKDDEKDEVGVGLEQEDGDEDNDIRVA